MRGSVRSAGVGARPKQRDDETELEVEQMEDSPDQNTRVVRGGLDRLLVLFTLFDRLALSCARIETLAYSDQPDHFACGWSRHIVTLKSACMPRPPLDLPCMHACMRSGRS